MTTNHNQKLKDFIDEHSSLFWYTPKDKKENISPELLLETILNYGTLDDCLNLFQLIGFGNAYRMLQSVNGRKKMNYYPEIYNFFKLYLSKNA